MGGVFGTEQKRHPAAKTPDLGELLPSTRLPPLKPTRPENLEQEEGGCLGGSGGTRRSCLKEFWPTGWRMGPRVCECVGAKGVSLVPRISSSGWVAGPEEGGCREREGERATPRSPLGPRQLLPSLHLPPPS